jgi:hypothetical protein
MVWRMIRTPEEIEQGLVIARRYIDAQDYALRETALLLLQKYSSIEKEATLVLSAVQKYLDENFIEALQDASPETVLEPLKELRSSISEAYAEYRDLSATIDMLEQKKLLADKPGA